MLRLIGFAFFLFFLATSMFHAEDAPRDTRSPSEIAADKTAANVPTGPEIFGVFRGRTPCQELSECLRAQASYECNKIKCRLILCQDPVTKTPTTYMWAGKVRRDGKWSIAQETTNPRRTIYKLEMADTAISLIKVDDNILYIRGPKGDPLVGNSEFSYTLNRIISHPDQPSRRP